MILEIHIKALCPDCDTTNWLDAGDDLYNAGSDVGGFKCWKCSHVFVLGDDTALNGEEDADLYEKGKRKPS